MDGFLPRKGVTLCSTGNEFEPMRRCLAPEVVSRRDRTGPQASKRRNADEVGVTLNAALACSPDNRIKWFMKACEMAKNGRASGNELFNIISNKKFLAGLDTRTGTTLCGLAHESASLFSEGQVRYMQSNEWLLNAKFGFNEDEKSPDAEAPEERSPSNDDEQRPVFRTRHPDGDEEVARRLELERKLDAQEKERRWKRELRKNTSATQDVDFTVRLMSKQSEKTTEELEQEADNSLQVLEQLNQRGRRREEADEDPRDAAAAGRRRRRLEESFQVQKNSEDVGDRRRQRREEVEADLGDVLDGGDRRRRRRGEPEEAGDDFMDTGERRRHRREDQVERPGETYGARRRREDIEDKEPADVVDDGTVRRRRRRRRSNLDVPSPPPEQDHPGPIKRRRRRNRSQSTSVSVQAARISPSSSREPDRRRYRGTGSSALARYEDNAAGRYASHRQADEQARQQAEQVAAHRELVRREAEELRSNQQMLSMQHVEALRDVYRQDRISRNRAKLMKLGLGHELGM